MKSWALGEELPTIRFTMLMRVSLSLICSRGRNGRTDGSLGPGDARISPTPHTHTPWLSAVNGGGAAALGASSTRGLASPLLHPANCFRTSTDGCCPRANATCRVLGGHETPERPEDSALRGPATNWPICPLLPVSHRKTTPWEGQSPQTDTKLI